MRSDALRISRQMHYAMGLVEEDFNKPVIGIASTWTDTFPGHIGLDRLAKNVADGVYMAGGLPRTFGTIAVSDCFGGQHNPDKGIQSFSLASRDLIADSVEAMAAANHFDALVLLAGCDKIIPGMLIAAARINIPTIIVTAGAMLPGKLGRYDIDITSDKMMMDECAAGRVPKEMLQQMECHKCPGEGSCAGLFTANSMACVAEILGMALPYNGTAPAVSGERTAIARNAGIRIMDMVAKDLKPSDILTREAFENAIRVDMMMGGSTNTVLHLLAIAHEAGVPLNLKDFDTFSKATPEICKITPSGKHFIVDMHNAGGIPALMKRAQEGNMLHGECMTVTGRTVEENLKSVCWIDDTVIRPLSDPYDETGGLAILYGNLSTNGAVIKAAACPRHMWHFKGTALCCESEAEAFAALAAGRIKDGQVIVIRNVGPKGAPGMPEMAGFVLALQQAGFGETVALITDGRFSGITSGPCIGYISPEANQGGAIGLIKDGDEIEYDIENSSLNICISDEELQTRRDAWVKPAPRKLRGHIAKYVALVGPANEGAVVSAENLK